MSDAHGPESVRDAELEDRGRGPHPQGVLVAGPRPAAYRSRRRPTWLRRTLYAVGAPVAVALVKLLWWTYRFDLVVSEEARAEVATGRPLILTFWHDSLFVLVWYLERLGREGLRVTYLVSPSADGDLAVRMLDVLGGRAVRGSATRSGVKAMRGLYREIARHGASPVVAPDGPQGPPHQCKPGPVVLAQLARALVLPIACAASPGWRLRTWDRLRVPAPFARVAVVVGEPLRVPAELDDGEQELHRRALETRLESLVERAEKRLRG